VNGDWKEDRIVESTSIDEREILIPKMASFKELMHFLNPGHNDEVQKVLRIAQSVGIGSSTAQQGQAMLDPIFSLDASMLYPDSTENRFTSNDLDVCLWKRIKVKQAIET